MAQAIALEDNSWTEEAVATIADLARRGGTVTADDLRRHHRPAPHPNKVGPAFRIAKSRGFIRPAGNANSKIRSRHGGGFKEWVAA